MAIDTVPDAAVPAGHPGTLTANAGLYTILACPVGAGRPRDVPEHPDVVTRRSTGAASLVG